MAAKNLHVYVYESDGELRVYPPLVTADGGGPDKLVLHNNTNDDLVFCFGPKSLHATDPIFHGVNSKTMVTTGPVKSQGGTGSAEMFPFQVVAFKSGKKAKGNSDPMLIIEN
jgi:hypothetical protein